MTTGPLNLAFGNHTKITAAPGDRAQIRAFYGDILGCEVKTPMPDMDAVCFPNNFFMGVLYRDTVLDEAQHLKAAWLELKTDDPAALKKKVVAFGVKEVDYFDKQHFYFRAPGGQIWRISATAE
jgi:catechol 2,3-dioxygenase-like lactoylglutathione lyase family enzyme